jgi:hypothetical protein
MIIVIQNDTSKSSHFNYVEQTTRVFRNDEIGLGTSGLHKDYWHDYCLSGDKNKYSFIEYLQILGFKEEKNIYEINL